RHSKSNPGLPGYLERRAAKIAKRTADREAIARGILSGALKWSDVDEETVNMVTLQDDVAQMGVGSILTRRPERLGRSDAAVPIERKLWTGELNCLERGEPLKEWRYDHEALPVKAEY